MFKALLKKIRFWNSIKEMKGEEIDYNNCWIIDHISDKNKFLSFIISNVPDDSIWTIEGILDGNIIIQLEPFFISDDKKVSLGTIWPKEKLYKIKINSGSRDKILSLIPYWDLTINFIHQHIYRNKDFYLTSYDNLDNNCTWISKYFNEESLRGKSYLGLLEYQDSNKIGNA